MAFGIYIFIVVIIFDNIRAQTIQSTQRSDGTNLTTLSTSQVEDDVTSSSALNTEALTENSESVYEKKYSSSFTTDVPTTWNNATIGSKEDMGIAVETVSLLSSITPEESTKSASRSSETLFTYMSEKLETSANDTHSFDASISSTQTQQIGVDVSVKESEIVITEDTNITTYSDLWNIRNTSRESRMFTIDGTMEQQEYQLIILRSNCSIVNSENISLSDDLGDVGCTIHLRLNLSSENATRDKLLRTLKELNIKPNEYHMVEMHNQNEDAIGHSQQNEHRGFVFDPETFAYLAVAVAFAFLLLLAVMVFGFRCFRKRRPSLDISRFDVRLSNYTLTKIPRASLSATDSLHESECMDDKPESSTVRSKNGGSCESGLDIIPCDTYTSNREMKTFGVCRPNVSTNSSSPSDIYPQHNPIAYENHTFQRYF